MRIGLGINLGGSIDDVLARFQKAESDGFAAAWAASATFDPLALLALAGRVTSTIELGTFIIPTYPRHPLTMAQQALTTASASGNRLTLGIGLSHRVVIEDRYGLDFSKPIRHMREYLSVLMPALAGQDVAFDGEEFRVHSQVVVNGATKPPVLVAALGPQMLRLAGRLADGTAIWMGNARYLREVAVPTIAKSAADAGRAAPRVAAGFPIIVTNARDAARAQAAKSFAIYGQLPSYRAVLDMGGLGGPEDLAIIGDEGEVRARLRELADSGVTDFHASPFRLKEDPDAHTRTNDFLGALAKSGL